MVSEFNCAVKYSKTVMEFTIFRIDHKLLSNSSLDYIGNFNTIPTKLTKSQKPHPVTMRYTQTNSLLEKHFFGKDFI